MATDHLGCEYKTVQEMCNHYHISVQTYYYRIKHGYTLEQALIFKKEDTRNIAKTKFDNCQNPVDKEERIDNLGNIYPSKTQMCEQYGISRGSYDYRRKLGWTVEKALCSPVNRKLLPVEKRTINGIVYKTVLEIRKDVLNNKISERTLYGLLVNCTSTNEAIQTAKANIRQQKIREMRANILEKYGLNHALYYSRICRGWPIVKALTTPKTTELLEEGRTYEGVTYQTINEMCIAFGMSPSAYLQRIYRGASKEIALLTPVNTNKSMMEVVIADLLSCLMKQKRIEKYVQSYCFEECRDKAKLPFDFLIEKNGKIGIIEFDGRQHFVPNCFWSLEEVINRGYMDIADAAKKEFEIIRKHDIIKNEFCAKNRIPLLRIKDSQSCHVKKMIEDFINGLDSYCEKINPFQANEDYYRIDR